MAALNVSAYSPVLKTLYPDGLAAVLYPKNPTFALLPKSDDFEGENMTITCKFGGSTGDAVDFATAQAGKSGSQYTKFTITRSSEYAVGGLTTEVMRASRSNKGALAKALKTEIDSSLYKLGRAFANGIWGNGGGAIGKISAGSNVGTATITLSDISQIVNFEKGMVLQASVDDGTAAGGLRSAGTTVTVAGVDRDAGTITATGNWTAGIAAVAASDFLFRKGDYAAKVKGIPAWLPDAAPSATLFFGVDRTQDTVRLGGARWNAAGVPIEEALIEAPHRLAIHGGSPTHGILNNRDFANVVKATQSRVFYDEDTDIPGIGFKSIVIPGPSGDIKLIPDPNCPRNKLYLLQMDTWGIHHLGALPGFIDDDGQGQLMRDSTADSMEYRMVAFWQLACEEPGWNMVVTNFGA
jgi:hypothetical protein